MAASGRDGTVDVEPALREGRADFDRAQALARTGSWRFDITRKTFSGSAEAYRIFGTAPGMPVTYEYFLAAVHRDDREHVDRRWQEALKGASYDIEFRIGVGKIIKWLRGRAELEYDPAGKLLGFFGTVQDITDKKETEEKLRQSEARYRMLHESLRDAFVQVAMDGRIIECNDIFCQMLGYSADEVRTLTYQELTPEHWRQYEDSIVRDQIIPRGYSDVYEKEYRRKDGTVFPVELRAILSRDSSGQPHLMWAIVRDISARKQAEAALRESVERLRLANEAGEIGTFRIDTEAGVAHYSPQLSLLLGVPGVESASIEAALARVHRDDVGRVRHLFTQALKGANDGHVKMDFRFVRPGGEVRWMTWIGRTDFRESPKGRVPHRIIGACLDITERKRQEERVTTLMREVNHRAKNMLHLVQIIARRTAASSTEDFLRRFEQRIQALAANQDLLLQNGWRGVDLNTLLRSQLSHFKDLVGTRIELDGPSIHLSPPAAQAIGMAIHELATNAGKYGALSGLTGRVKITWATSHDEGRDERFHITWQEVDGPPVQKPMQRGFGSTVLTSLAESGLDAEVELLYEPAGVTWRLTCPGNKLSS